MGFIKQNVASQTIRVFAFNATTGAGATGEAANITAVITPDSGVAVASNDTNPAELNATTKPGIYQFDLTQAETNVTDYLELDAVCSTPNIEVITLDGPRFYTAVDITANVPTTIDITDAVWDEARSSHVTVGSFGEGMASVQGNVTGTVASVTGAVGSVTGAVGSVTAGVTVTTNNDKTDYTLSAAGVDAILDEAITEPAAAFTWPATLRNIMAWIGALSRNRILQTSNTTTLRNDADSADIETSTVSDVAGTFTRGEWGV